jgi:pyruvate,orthophosphate dikinase
MAIFVHSGNQMIQQGELVMKRKWVFAFEEGDGKNKMLLGGKGANLCEMTQIGLNVPPGFVITTDACLAFLDKDRLPEGAMEETLAHMKALEKKTGKTFGGGDNPLLVSVRSGSSMSMPGMMDTVLNLGLNPVTLKGLIAQTGNARFGYDAWRRFIQLFGKIALGIADEHFDAAMALIKSRYGAAQDIDLKAEHLAELATEFLGIVQRIPASPSPKIPTSNWKSPSGGVPLLERQACHRLSPSVQDHQGNGQRHSGEHLHHGLRQHGQ